MTLRVEPVKILRMGLLERARLESLPEALRTLVDAMQALEEQQVNYQAALDKHREEYVQLVDASRRPGMPKDPMDFLRHPQHAAYAEDANLLQRDVDDFERLKLVIFREFGFAVARNAGTPNALNLFDDTLDISAALEKLGREMKFPVFVETSLKSGDTQEQFCISIGSYVYGVAASGVKHPLPYGSNLEERFQGAEWKMNEDSVRQLAAAYLRGTSMTELTFGPDFGKGLTGQTEG